MRCPLGIPAFCLVTGLSAGLAHAQSCPPRWQGFTLGGSAFALLGAGTFTSIGTTPAMNFATHLASAGIDFKNDGPFQGTSDIDGFLSVFSGGPCG